MTPSGWLLLVLSLSFVWGLVIWCYTRMLSDDPAEAEGEPPTPIHCP